MQASESAVFSLHAQSSVKLRDVLHEQGWYLHLQPRLQRYTELPLVLYWSGRRPAGSAGSAAHTAVDAGWRFPPGYAPDPPACPLYCTLRRAGDLLNRRLEAELLLTAHRQARAAVSMHQGTFTKSMLLLTDEA